MGKELRADFTIPSAFPHGGKISRLPDGLVHAANAEYLLGSAAVLGGSGLINGLQIALRTYRMEANLLALINLEAEAQTFPSIGLWVVVDKARPQLSRLMHDVLPPTGLQPGVTLRIDEEGKPHRTFTCDLMPLISTAASVVGSHVVYSHVFVREQDGQKGEGRGYVGVTRQGWEQRWQQHVAAAERGSPYLFHKAVAEFLTAAAPGDWERHSIIGCGLSHADAMNLEELVVDQCSLYPRGLNMIPGGFAGIRYLAKQGFGAAVKNWDHRHLIIRRFAEHCERAQRPNPLAAALWRDDGYAANIICANPNNFTAEDVALVRLLDSYGKTPIEIAAQLECREERVRNLLRGETYSRVH
jgi:hypothetical protein